VVAVGRQRRLRVRRAGLNRGLRGVVDLQRVGAGAAEIAARLRLIERVRVELEGRLDLADALQPGEVTLVVVADVVRLSSKRRRLVLLRKAEPVDERPVAQVAIAAVPRLVPRERGGAVAEVDGAELRREGRYILCGL